MMLTNWTCCFSLVPKKPRYHISSNKRLSLLCLLSHYSNKTNSRRTTPSITPPLNQNPLRLILQPLPSPCTVSFNFFIKIQLFRERLSENVQATIPKGNKGYDQYAVSDDCTCRTYFCCFSLALANTFPRPFVPILSNFFEEQWT